MTKKLTKITECPECGKSNSLSWTPVTQILNSVQNGRLRTHDVGCLFVLGCDYCSETVATVSADAVAAFLSQDFAEDSEAAPELEGTTL